MPHLIKKIEVEVAFAKISIEEVGSQWSNTKGVSAEVLVSKASAGTVFNKYSTVIKIIPNFDGELS